MLKNLILFILVSVFSLNSHGNAFDEATSNPNANTPLMKAAMKGDNETVQKLLDQKVDVNARNKIGNTAVDLAAMMKRDDTIELLVKHGATVNVTPSGMTALMIAANANSYSTVRKLIELGWKPDFVNKNGQSALTIASTDKRDDAVIGLLTKMDLKKAICNKDVKSYDINRYHNLTLKKLSEKEFKGDQDLIKLASGLEVYKSNSAVACPKSSPSSRLNGLFPKASQ